MSSTKVSVVIPKMVSLLLGATWSVQPNLRQEAREVAKASFLRVLE
jgi:hypothetical protein